MKLSALLLLPAALREAFAYTALSDESLARLHSPSPSTFSISDPASLLAPILIPRVPGTPGSDSVLHFFADFFAHSLPEWRIEYQNSTSTTPTSGGKEIPFRNLIATRDPPWLTAKDGSGDGDVARLALAAHYDSKLTPTGFIGATDSAAPCAMLLHVARALDAALTKKWANPRASDGLDDEDANKGLQILLLDGEEAFQTWTHTDSLYGARSLAAEWEDTAYGYGGTSMYRNPLDSIELFVLLDLLGAANPVVPSYFKTTHWAYQLMSSVESRLRALERSPLKTGKAFLPDAGKEERGQGERWLGGYIEDDHLPFMARGVEILHLIPSPFPGVWHTMADDGAHLDIATVEDWAVVTAAFAAEWLDLDGFLEGDGVGGEEGRRGRDEL